MASICTDNVSGLSLIPNWALASLKSNHGARESEFYGQLLILRLAILVK